MKVSKALLLVIAALFTLLIVLLVVLPQLLGYHDRKARKEILDMVARELPVGAPERDMEQFMRRHTSRFALDDRFHREFDGIVLQSTLDKNLFDVKFRSL